MDIRITEEALDIIKSKQGIATISPVIYRGCCNMKVPELQVELRRPADLNSYLCQSTGDVTIFIFKDLVFKNNKLTIDLKGIGPFKHLQVSGLESLF